MFGLNPKDAQGAMEDQFIMKSLQPAPSRVAQIYETVVEIEAHAATTRSASKAIRVRDDKLRDVAGRFDGLTAEYTDLMAMSRASRAVVDALADDLAAALKLDPAEVRARAYAAMSRQYDSQLGQMLSTGELKKDPRKDPAVMARKTREWYSPEL